MWSRWTRAGPADSTQVRYALPLFDFDHGEIQARMQRSQTRTR